MGIKNVGDSVAVHRYFFTTKGLCPELFHFHFSSYLCRIQKGSQMEQILKWNMGAQNTGEKEKDGMHKVIRELTPNNGLDSGL